MEASRRQDGQALVIVLAFMVLSIPMVTGALGLASALSVDSSVKTRILKRHYSGMAAQQQALHDLLSSPGSSTTTLIINATTITTTIIKLDNPPRDVPTYALAGRLVTTKTVSPTSTSLNGTTTYTITVKNSNTETTTTTKIVDVLPSGFQFVSSTAVMKDSNGTTISTSDPTPVVSQLQWAVPSAYQQLGAGNTMTLSFVAQTASTPGVYCNEAFVYPGGEDTSSGRTAEVTVGTTTETNCEGGILEVTKTVEPAMVSSNVSTTYTFLIKMENRGNVGISIKEVIDTTSDGFTYVPGSTTSSPASLPIAESTTTSVTIGEPTTDLTKDTISWEFETIGVYLATSTTWYIQFEATADLTRGFYPNTVDVVFAGNPYPSPSQDDYCQFGEDKLTISSGSTVTCSIGSNGKVKVEKDTTITGDIVSLNGDVDIKKDTVITGDILALGGEVKIEKDVVITGNIIAAGEIELKKDVTVVGNVISGEEVELDKDSVVDGFVWSADEVEIDDGATVKGDVISRGDVEVDKDATVEGSIWTDGDVEIDKDATVLGNIFSGGDVEIDKDATITGNITAAGTVTVESGATVTGTITSGATVPPVPLNPPIDLRSSGTTAIVTAIDIYRITTTDGETTTTCDVYVMEDSDVGTVGTVENCTNA